MCNECPIYVNTSPGIKDHFPGESGRRIHIYLKIFFILRKHERDLGIFVTQINVSSAVIVNPVLPAFPFRRFVFFLIQL